MSSARVTTDQIGDTRIQRIEGQVPHTVLSLPSGRTLAYGKNPHAEIGNRPDQYVQSAIQVLLDLESGANRAGGRVSAQSRAQGLERLAEVQVSLERDADNGAKSPKAEESATWARVVLGHVRRLVASMPTQE